MRSSHTSTLTPCAISRSTSAASPAPAAIRSSAPAPSALATRALVRGNPFRSCQPWILASTVDASTRDTTAGFHKPY